MKAAHDALHTAELLELILIGVDMRTLLVAQRVSRYWYESMKNSVRLQKKLFLIPATTKDIIELNIAKMCRGATGGDSRAVKWSCATTMDCDLQDPQTSRSSIRSSDGKFALVTPSAQNHTRTSALLDH